jgi:nicotinic acetylcholine receptor, invertebrate
LCLKAEFYYIITLLSFFYFCSLTGTGPFGGSCQIHGPLSLPNTDSEDLSVPQPTAVPNIEADANGVKSPMVGNPGYSHNCCPPEVHRSCFCVRFIAEHTKMLEDSTKVSEMRCER